MISVYFYLAYFQVDFLVSSMSTTGIWVVFIKNDYPDYMNLVPKLLL